MFVLTKRKKKWLLSLILLVLLWKQIYDYILVQVSILSYWTSTYIWDFVSFLFPSSFAIILFYIFGTSVNSHFKFYLSDDLGLLGVNLVTFIIELIDTYEGRKQKKQSYIPSVFKNALKLKARSPKAPTFLPQKLSSFKEACFRCAFFSFFKKLKARFLELFYIFKKKKKKKTKTELKLQDLDIIDINH